MSRWLLAAIALSVLLVASLVTANLHSNPGQQLTRSQAAPQSNLRSSVETAEGAPQAGRNPASQRQDSLAAVASLPNGNGQRVSKTAAGISDTHNSHGHSQADLPAAANGALANGCLAGYGAADQCLPASLAAGGKIENCSAVRQLFPEGVKITQTDRFHIDANSNGIGCDATD